MTLFTFLEIPKAATLPVISSFTCKQGERVSSALYLPFCLVRMHLQTKEDLPTESTTLTVIKLHKFRKFF